MSHCEVQNLDNILRGKGLYPDIEEKLKDYYRHHLARHHMLMARENKMHLSDWLIVGATEEIANTKINRKLHKDKIIKPYPETAEYIRILK